MSTIYFAGGCFWGTEHFFKQIDGVISTQTGFANGNESIVNPTYEQVYTDQTGYAEAVMVVYDEAVVSLEFLVNMFFAAIDPLAINRQGHDIGTRYRTGVYYTSKEQLAVIQRVFEEQQTKFTRPLAVELLPLKNYFPASEYHQDYLDKHPDGYCHLPLSLFKWAREQHPLQQKSSGAVDQI
ncbi:MAG: peptide-methionine (S)-S-oxide reductase MsrA [Paludibacteraceae bacterium]|nr:peptide-methionine (S)-S-oxide reductase MsrA [Paludibacteraceae bacterium]